MRISDLSSDVCSSDLYRIVSRAPPWLLRCSPPRSMPASRNLSQVFDRHRLSNLRKLSLDRKQAEAHGQPHRRVAITALSEEDALRHRQGTCNSPIRNTTSSFRHPPLMRTGREMA